MVRMSDIFKRKQEENGLNKPAQPVEKSLKTPEIPAEIIKPIPSASAQKQNEPTLIAKPFGLAGIMRHKEEPVKFEQPFPQTNVAGIYERCVGQINKLLKAVKDKQNINIVEIIDIVDMVRINLDNQRNAFLECAYSSEAKDYLASHIANVLIYSLVFGISLGYQKDRLIKLGIAAVVFDISMVDYMDLAELPRKLTQEELKIIFSHVDKSAAIFHATKYMDSPQDVVNIILQHHERLDGTGYPKNLSFSQISEGALLISVADVFDALTHKRAYRPEFLAFDAVKEILNKKSQFDARAIKALLDNVTIYPTGSWVQLNNDDMAKVVALHSGYPLRPSVQICYDVQLREYSEKKIIDLTKNLATFIKRPIIAPKP